MYRDVMLDGAELKYMYTELVYNRKIFKRLIDAFFAAAIMGYLKSEYVICKEKDENNRKRIPQSAFINNTGQYKIILDTIALLHLHKTGEEDILNKIFDDKDEALNNKLTIVENYATGGIRILYDNLVGNDSTNIDDSVERACKLVNNFEEKFEVNEDREDKSFDEIISNILN